MKGSFLDWGRDRAICTGEICRRVQIARAPDQFHGRCADRCPEAHARNGERIVVTPESKYPLPAAHADDKAALREDDANRPGLGL